jgi:hypothetical protein
VFVFTAKTDQSAERKAKGFGVLKSDTQEPWELKRLVRWTKKGLMTKVPPQNLQPIKYKKSHIFTSGEFREVSTHELLP